MLIVHNKSVADKFSFEVQLLSGTQPDKSSEGCATTSQIQDEGEPTVFTNENVEEETHL